MFVLLAFAQIWMAHAVAFFAHEYAHAFTAWLLGWKANPLGLHYGHLTTANLLLMSDIDENVHYAPIFAAGNGWQAGVIAGAGVAIGNGLITYPVSLWGYAVAKDRDSRVWAMFFYWLCVMSVGEFICYVPVRTFSYREDMHTVTQGFGCSPMWILLVLGVPFAIALVHFLMRVEPCALRWIASGSRLQMGAMALLTAGALFGFFGAAGWSDSGALSHEMSVVSVCVLFPVTAAVGWWAAARRSLANAQPSAPPAS